MSEHTNRVLEEEDKIGDLNQQIHVVDPSTSPLHDTITTMEGQSTIPKDAGSLRSIPYRRSIEIRNSEDRRLDYYRVDAEAQNNHDTTS